MILAEMRILYKEFVFTIAVILMGAGVVLGQDAQFTQFYTSPLNINPAYAGSTIQQRFSLLTRLQWPNAPEAFTSYVFSYDFNLPVLNSGFGFLASTDKQGTADLRTTNAALNYAYRVQFADIWVLSAGIQFGVGFRSINREKFLFGDQFDFQGGQGQSSDPDLALLQTNASYFDFASGIVAYNANSWLGVSVYHMNQPNQSFLGDQSELPMKWHIHGGVKLELYKGAFRRSRIPILSPGFLYKRQGNFDQLDVGTNFFYNPIMVGLWYRGLPLFNSVLSNVKSQDAIAALVGLKFQKLEVAYSYDVTTSGLGPSSGGAHELSVIYQYAYYRGGKKKKIKPIPCPSFNSSVMDEFKY